MTTPTLEVGRGHIVGVLVANAILWATAVLLTGNHLLGGPGVAGLVSIGSLLFVRSRAT